jgi:non-homologous end joining protein Ku
VQKGVALPAAKKSTTGNVVNLMDALRASIGQLEKTSPQSGRCPKTPAKKAAKTKKSA